MSPQAINVIIIASFGVIAVIGFLRGYFKGLFRSCIDLGFSVAGIVISILLTKGLSKVVITKDAGGALINLLSSWFGNNQYFDAVKGYMENPAVNDTVNIAVALPTIILSPILFIIVLFIVALVLKIPRTIIEWLMIPKMDDLAVKVSGAAITAVRYALALLVILVPLTGYLNYATNTIDLITQSEENGEVALLDEGGGSTGGIKDNQTVKAVYMVKDNPIIQMTYNLGGRPLFELFTTTDAGGISLNLGVETEIGVEIYKAAMEFKGVNLGDYSQKQIDALNRINKSLDKSLFMTSFASDIISLASGEMLDKGEFLGIKRPDLTETLNPTVDRILGVLKSTTKESIKNDIDMVTSIAESTIKHGVLKEFSSDNPDFLNVVENDVYLDEIFVALYRNERTRNALPYLSTAINNYLVRLYNEMNGENEIPTEFDYANYTEDMLDDEALRIVNTIKKFEKFVESTKEYKDDKQSLASFADLESFGEACEIARESVLIGRSFSFFVYAFLHSEGCAELGIVDKYFIENATKPDADISQMLVARQTLIRLTLSMQSIGTDGSKHQMIESVIETMLSGDNAAIQELITKEYLEDIGVDKSSAGTINGIVNSVIDAAAEQSFASDEEMHDEIVKTEIIINAISNSVVDDSNTHMFTEGRDRGNANMSASELVDRVSDSSLVSSMVQKAVENDASGIDDPYHIQENMTERDINAISNAISDKYNSSEASEQEKETMEALAKLFGVTIK